jgi:hypothetical protein
MHPAGTLTGSSPIGGSPEPMFIIADQRPDRETMLSGTRSLRIRRPNRREDARRLISASLARLAARSITTAVRA